MHSINTPRVSFNVFAGSALDNRAPVYWNIGRVRVRVRVRARVRVNVIVAQ